MPRLYRLVWGAVSVIRFVVGFDANEWQIAHGDRVTRGYESQAVAIRAAIEAANTAGKINQDGAQVLVRQSDGECRIEWTYGGDPYLPKKPGLLR